MEARRDNAVRRKQERKQQSQERKQQSQAEGEHQNTSCCTTETTNGAVVTGETDNEEHHKSTTDTTAVHRSSDDLVVGADDVEQGRPGAVRVRGYMSQSSEDQANSLASEHDDVHVDVDVEASVRQQNDEPTFYPVEAEVVRERNEEDFQEEIRQAVLSAMGEIFPVHATEVTIERQENEMREELTEEVMTGNARKRRGLIYGAGFCIAILIAVGVTVAAVVLTGGGKKKSSDAPSVSRESVQENSTQVPSTEGPTTPMFTESPVFLPTESPVREDSTQGSSTEAPTENQTDPCPSLEVTYQRCLSKLSSTDADSCVNCVNGIWPDGDDVLCSIFHDFACTGPYTCSSCGECQDEISDWLVCLHDNGGCTPQDC